MHHHEMHDHEMHDPRRCSRRTGWWVAVLLLGSLVAAGCGGGDSGSGSGTGAGSRPEIVNAQGPNVTVTNLRSDAVTVRALDGGPLFTIPPGRGHDLRGSAGPAGVWHVVVAAAGTTLFDEKIGFGPPVVLIVTGAGVSRVDPITVDDAGDVRHESQ